MPLGLFNNYSLINWQHPLMRGLISRWKVIPNRIGGNKFVDLCRRNHGILTNGPLWSSAFGRKGGNGSLSFDGVDDYVDISNIHLWTLGTYSISMWVNGASQTQKVIMSEGWSADSSPLFLLSNGGTISSKLRFFIRNNIGGTLLDVDSNGMFFDSTWHHMCVTENNGTYTIYRDGVFDKSGTYTRGTTTFDRASIGCLYRTSATSFFAGNIDDICGFGRVLSTSEVLALYNSTRSQYDNTLNYYNPNLRPISYSNFLVQHNNLPAYLGLNVLNGL